MHRLLPGYVVLICLLLMVPIIIVVILAFSGAGYLQFPPKSFSLRWFVRFLADPQWQAALWYSLVIGVIACVLATVVGFFAAYAFVRGSFPGKKLLLSLLLLPIIVPTVITSIAMYFISARLHTVGNLLWIGLCHAVIALPVVLLILVSTLQGVDANLERAALSLGASRARVFLKVVAPIAAPGLVSAALFAFLASFDELIISLFLTGIRAQTLPVRIWNSLHLEIEPTIAAVRAFLIAVTALVLLLDTLLRGRRAATMNAQR
jgi:ABC-type spermidine/putrescine transport system permease subunit II